MLTTTIKGLILSSILAAAPAVAEEAQAPAGPSSHELSEPTAEFQRGYQRWFCQARSTSWWASNRSFSGTSYYFPAGTGQSGEARRTARYNAVRACEFNTRTRCQSHAAYDCFLQNYW